MTASPPDPNDSDVWTTGRTEPVVGVLARLARTTMALAGWRAVLAVALSLLSAASSGLLILLLIPITQALGMGGTAVPASSLFSAVENLGGNTGLPAILLALIVATTLQTTLSAAGARTNVRVFQDVILGLRRRLFDVLTATEWVFFVRQRSSDLLQTLTHQTERAGYAVKHLLSLSATATVVVVYVGLAMAISLPATAVIIGAGSLLTVLLSGRRRAAADIGESVATAERALFRSLTETLASMKTIRSYDAGDRHGREIDAAGDQVRTVYVRLASAETGAKLWFDVGLVTIISTIVLLAIYQLSLAVAELVVLLALMVRLAPQLSALHSYYHSLLLAVPAITDIERTERNCRLARPIAPAVIEDLVLERGVRFQAVSFGYTDQLVLHDVDLDISAGRTVALVGPSGAGKTTVADLVLGLLKPTSGAVLVDGRPLTDAGVKGWRRQLGYVPQDTFLFHDSIRENLLWAAPGHSDEDLWEALRAAAAAEFVQALPNGLATIVGDRGALLSTGERQRLALARALLRQPRLLVLDEATSALDPENDRLIRRAIGALGGRVTVLLISHRLSSVRDADAIYVLDRGRIVESGSWTELCGRVGGRFHRLWTAQESANP